MNLFAFPRQIKTILEANRKYSIPRFQREYAWEEEEHQVFWKDIYKKINIGNQKLTISDYFIGALVLVGDDTKDTEFQVVDGQQRLTTITIILSVLTQIFKEINEDDFAQSCYMYIEGKDGNFKPFFKLQNENPKPFLQRRIQNMTKENEYNAKTEEEEKLLLAYNFYYNRLKKENLEKVFGTTIDYRDMLIGVRDQILGFKTIFITVNSIDEAYYIFETLNAKGKDLETIDLVKNKIFKILHNDHPTDEAVEKWKNIKNMLNQRDRKENISTFFRHFWLSKYEFTTDAKIYESFLKKVPEKEDEYKKFLSELEVETKNYLIQISPIQSDWKQQEEREVYNSLNAINLFGVSQARTIILSLINAKERKLINVNEFREIIKKIEKFHFIFTAICSSRSSGLEARYSTLARELRETINKKATKEIIKKLEQYFSDKKPEYEIFESKFNEIEFSNEKTRSKKLIQYIFSEIEKYKHSTDELLPFNLSIEHIKPQSSKEDIALKLGNLLPLSKEINSSLKDKDLQFKVPELKKSELKTIKEFIEMNETKPQWEKTDIEKRTQELSNLAYNEVWKF